MVLLYEHPLSPYVQKVKIALREKAIAFETRAPLLAGGVDEVFARANPRAEVPVLIDGETRVFDSTIILEYIEDKWPEPPLLPSGPAERARVRLLEEICDTQYEAVNWGLGEIVWFNRGTEGVADTLRHVAAEQIEAIHNWLGAELGERPWFNGDSFGWGDLAVVPYVRMSALFGFRPVEHSKLNRWLTRASEVPSVSVTAMEAAATIAQMPEVAKMVRDGAFQREYRDHRLEWMIRSGGLEVVLDGLRKGTIRFSQGFA